MKTSMILLALALIAFVVVLGLRPEEPFVSGASQGPSFEVHVVKPLSARPLFGLLPDGLFGLPANELRIDQTSPGAKIGKVGQHRLELAADGWDLLLEIDGEGRIAPGTRLLFPVELGDRQLSLRCRVADPASGSLRAATRPGSDELDGDFHAEFAICENAETGKVIEWPQAPLAVYGSFEGLPPTTAAAGRPLRAAG